MSRASGPATGSVRPISSPATCGGSSPASRWSTWSTSGRGTEGFARGDRGAAIVRAALVPAETGSGADMARTLGVIVAGGRGRRLGLEVPKALAAAGGMTLLDRAVATLEEVC